MPIRDWAEANEAFQVSLLFVARSILFVFQLLVAPPMGPGLVCPASEALPAPRACILSPERVECLCELIVLEGLDRLPFGFVHPVVAPPEHPKASKRAAWAGWAGCL